MNWADVSKIAFLGTDRTGLGEISQQDWDAFKLFPDEGDPAETLVKLAILVNTREKAGKKYPLADFILTSNKQTGPQQLSSRAALYLESILDNSYPGALPEFLDLVTETQQKIPTYLLPDLMALVEDQQLSWKSLQEILGPNAHSFLRLHPVWKNYISESLQGDWQSTNLKKKENFLLFLRSVHPAEAIHHLESSWEKESIKNKLHFLEILKTGLSKEDSVFLEKSLEDANLKIRHKSAELLLLIPDSSLSIQLFDLIFQHIEETEQDELMVNLPEKEDVFWKKIGFQKKDRNHDYGSQSAYLLGQLISHLHPSFWNTFLNLSPEECLLVFENSQQYRLLQKSIVAACILHQDQDWLDAIVAALFAGKGPSSDIYVDALPYVSAPTFNKVLLRQVKNKPFLLEENGLVYPTLELCEHPWSDELAFAILSPFQQWLATAQSAQWSVWHYKKILKLASYRINPNLASSLKSGWQFQSYIAFQWQEDVEKFNRRLIFRKGMRKAIMESAKRNNI